MQDIIIGMLLSVGVGLVKNWRHWSKVQTAAKAIVEDTSNPINDPKEALEQAFIAVNSERIKKQAAGLGDRLELAKMRAEATRQAELADPYDVELVPRDGTEEFKSPWSDGGGK